MGQAEEAEIQRLTIEFQEEFEFVPESKSEIKQSTEQTRPSISRMRSLYNLEAGKLGCRCLIRKWCFCKHIRNLADGKVTPGLVKCPELPSLERSSGSNKDRKSSSGGQTGAKEAAPFLDIESLETLIKLSQARDATEENPPRRSDIQTDAEPDQAVQTAVQTEPDIATEDQEVANVDQVEFVSIVSVPPEPDRKSRRQIKASRPSRQPRQQKMSNVQPNTRQVKPTNNLQIQVKRKRGRPTKSMSLISTDTQLNVLNSYWKREGFILNQSVPEPNLPSK